MIAIEIKCTINVMGLNLPKTILPTPSPSPRKNCLPQSRPWCQNSWVPPIWNLLG